MKYFRFLIAVILIGVSTQAQNNNSSLVLKNKSIDCIKIIEKRTKNVTSFVFKNWPSASLIYRIVFLSKDTFTKYRGDGSVSLSGKYYISGGNITLKGATTSSVYKIVNQKDSPFITLQNTEGETDYIQYCIISE